jgi:drug/metabolite transporter (DMT)-like permease
VVDSLATVVDAPTIPLARQEHDRRPTLGYAMVTLAAVLFAVNGTVSKVVLGSGISSLELTQVRSIGACLGFLAALAMLDPGSLRVTRRELPFLVLFGVTGVAFVQWFYFVAIHRLPLGIALLIQYLAPLIVALFARYVLREPVRRRIWLALALSLTGLALVLEVWQGLTLDSVGVGAALAAAFAYAVYVLMAEHEVGRRDPASLTFYGFLFAAIFWAVVQPVWEFPAGQLDDSVSLLGNLESERAPVWLLMLFVVIVGTMVTFALIASALRHVSATRVGITAMLEPVLASLVAWAWLGETFGAAQLTGGGIVLAAILIAQTAR